MGNPNEFVHAEELTDSQARRAVEELLDARYNPNALSAEDRRRREPFKSAAGIAAMVAGMNGPTSGDAAIPRITPIPFARPASRVCGTPCTSYTGLVDPFKVAEWEGITIGKTCCYPPDCSFDITVTWRNTTLADSSWIQEQGVWTNCVIAIDTPGTVTQTLSGGGGSSNPGQLARVNPGLGLVIGWATLNPTNNNALVYDGEPNFSAQHRGNCAGSSGYFQFQSATNLNRWDYLIKVNALGSPCGYK